MKNPTTEEMERARDWAVSASRCGWEETNRPAIWDLARCYLHALKRIEALEKVREALVYCVESERTELSDSAYDKAVEALTNLDAMDAKESQG